MFLDMSEDRDAVAQECGPTPARFSVLFKDADYDEYRFSFLKNLNF